MKIQKVIILFVFILQMAAHGNNTDNDLYFRSFRLKDGLPGSTVTTIKQDQLGFIWIGTNDGLCRFDGTQFRIFKNELGNPNSLSDNFIQNLYFDSDDKLWIMTAKGLDLFNLKQQKITRFIADGKAGSIADNSPIDIVETRDGTLYVGSYYQGISYKTKNETLFKYLNESTVGKSRLNSNWITNLELVNDSVLVIGYREQGIDFYNLKTGETNHIQDISEQSLSSSHINTIQQDFPHGLWIGTNAGLSYYNCKTKVIQNFDYIEDEKSFVTDYEILSLFLDKKGNLWMGTRNKGIVVAQTQDILSFGKKAEFISYLPSYREGSVSYRSISSIFEDRDGYMWIGTHGGGINYVENRNQRFGHLQFETGNENSISYSKVWGMCEDDSGNIWLGTDGEGINVWNPTTKKIKLFKHDPGDSNSLSDNAIISACTDYTGQVWIGTYSGGLNRYSPATGRFYHYKAPEELPVNDIRCIYEDEQKELWIGTNQGGIARYNREKDHFQPVEAVNGYDVRCLLRKNNTLWIGTYGQGLVKYDIETGARQVYVPGTENNGISSQTIFSMCMTNDSSLWLGTRNGGINLLNTNTGKVTVLSEKDGLSNNTVHSILFEAPDHLWMSTNKGISNLNISSGTFTNYGWLSGVQSEEFHNGSGLITSKGLFCFGGINGFNYFYPQNFKSSTPPGKIHFTGLKILGEEVVPEQNGVIQKSIEYNPVVHLNYRHSVFTIDFQSIGSPILKDINYEFFLENYDIAWNRVGKQNSATYRNLPPGDYIFKVKTYQNNEPARGIEANLMIHMSPPFWRTWWAYLFYLLLISGLVIVIFRYRVQQFKIKNRLLYEQRLRNREKKLHRERLEFFTNISHELRTPLTLIGVAIEELNGQRNTGAKYQKSLDTATKNSNRLMELINRLMEFRETETGVSSMKVRKINLNTFIPEFLQGFREMAKHNQINLRLTLPINDVILWADSDKLTMILNNLLSNAFKHTPSHGQIIISVDVSEKNIILKVKDSGKGIPASHKDKIFKRYYKLDTESTSTGIGLALTKALVELHHAKIELDSKPGNGAVFAISFLKGNSHFTSEQLSVETSSDLVSEEQVNGRETEINPSFNKNQKIILLVDDNQEILDVLKDKFENEYKILTALNGKEGVEKAKEFIPNLIISDIMMPEMDGTELCTELKNDIATSHIPIILLTAKGTEEDEIKGLDTGADDYISKPFKVSILQARVRTIIDNRIKLFNYFSGQNGHSELEETDLKTSKEMAFLKKVEDYVLENCLNSEVSVFELAAELGYSRTTLYRKIKMLTNQSINGFVRSVKIKRSAALIAEGMNVSEAAYSTGFNDLKYFRESFKKMYGKNPSEFKA